MSSVAMIPTSCRETTTCPQRCHIATAGGSDLSAVAKRRRTLLKQTERSYYLILAPFLQRGCVRRTGDLIIFLVFDPTSILLFATILFPNQTPIFLFLLQMSSTLFPKQSLYHSISSCFVPHIPSKKMSLF